MLFFSYGMLTNNDVMVPTAKRLGVAVLDGYCWEMLRYANVYPSIEDGVVGILWEIDKDILTDLDLREGFPTMYTRLLVEVSHDDEMKMAWVYSMTDRYHDYFKDTVPNTIYLTSVREGYLTDGIEIED